MPLQMRLSTIKATYNQNWSRYQESYSAAQPIVKTAVHRNQKYKVSNVYLFLLVIVAVPTVKEYVTYQSAY